MVLQEEGRMKVDKGKKVYCIGCFWNRNKVVEPCIDDDETFCEECNCCTDGLYSWNDIQKHHLELQDLQRDIAKQLIDLT